MGKFRDRLTYANVASTLALVIAIGGGGTAVAMSVANNSVGSPEIINGSIKHKDLTNGKIGIWLFLASEVMLFGALFASYILMRGGSTNWPRGDTVLNVPLATLNTIVLIASSVTMVMAWASLMRRRFGTYRIYMGATILFGLVFLVVKYFEYSHKFHDELFPSTNNFLAIYFTLTGLHGLHVLGGMAVNAYFWGPGAKLWKTNPIVSPR